MHTNYPHQDNTGPVLASSITSSLLFAFLVEIKNGYEMLPWQSHSFFLASLHCTASCLQQCMWMVSFLTYQSRLAFIQAWA